MGCEDEGGGAGGLDEESTLQGCRLHAPPSYDWVGDRAWLSCRYSSGFQDGKVSSATLPGAGAQVASDHHLGKAGGLATQVLRRCCFSFPPTSN